MGGQSINYKTFGTELRNSIEGDIFLPPKIEQTVKEGKDIVSFPLPAPCLTFWYVL